MEFQTQPVCLCSHITWETTHKLTDMTLKCTIFRLSLWNLSTLAICTVTLSCFQQCWDDWHTPELIWGSHPNEERLDHAVGFPALRLATVAVDGCLNDPRDVITELQLGEKWGTDTHMQRVAVGTVRWRWTLVERSLAWLSMLIYNCTTQAWPWDVDTYDTDIYNKECFEAMILLNTDCFARACDGI